MRVLNFKAGTKLVMLLGLVILFVFSLQGAPAKGRGNSGQTSPSLERKIVNVADRLDTIVKNQAMENRKLHLKVDSLAKALSMLQSQVKPSDKNIIEDLTGIPIEYALDILTIVIIAILVFANFSQNKAIKNEFHQYKVSQHDKRNMQEVQSRISENKLLEIIHIIENRCNKYETILDELKLEAKKKEIPPVNASDVVLDAGSGLQEYHPSPTNEGYFLDRFISNTFKSGESIYVLTYLDPDRTTLEFEIINDRQVMQKAIKAPEVYLDPVCEDINEYNQNARAIKTEKAGKAKRENEKWRVTDKTQIRYIV